MSRPRATIAPFARSEANDPYIETQPYTESAGSRLRHEREAQMISEKEAAHKLHLMVTDLRAIEADSYSASANDNLLRNYLRDYANFLTLNPDSILAIYDRQAGTRFHRGANRIGDIPKAKTTSLGSLLTGGLVVTTVVLGFLVVMQFTNIDRVNALLVENSTGLEDDPQQISDSNVAATDEDFDFTPAAVAEESSALLAAAEIDPDPAEEARSQATTSDEVVERSDDGVVTEIAAAYRKDSGAGAAATAANVKTTDELSFRFAKDCWVEVYDADEKRLIAEIRKAGGSLQLSGKSPFKVLVGYSREVVLQFNGHPVDIEKIERSYSTLFRVERANDDTVAPKVTTIRRKLSDKPGKEA